MSVADRTPERDASRGTAEPRGRGDEQTPTMRFRYGVVFVITLVLLVFAIVAGKGAWQRACVLGLESVALAVVVATSREREEIRRARAILVSAIGATMVALVGADAVGRTVTFAFAGLLAAVIPVALVGGVARLIRERGVTLQAVLGALTIYLYGGLLFAWLIAFVSAVDSTPYFAQSHVGEGDRVYFSFTVLTTTGFGDFTAATSLGHALAVVEMLIGQLYLVTVIGVLVGHLVGGARRE